MLNEQDASGASVKYHLVEAEEVEQISPVAVKKQPKMKKGKVQWTSLPLTEQPTAGRFKGKQQFGKSANENTAPNNGYYKKHAGKKGKGNKWSKKQRYPEQRNATYINGVFVPMNDPKETAKCAMAQIEYYFTPDNLVRDTFLRQNMDVNGYVPLVFVANFQTVYSIHQDYDTLLNEMANSQILELDTENEKIRAREGWQKVSV